MLEDWNGFVSRSLIFQIKFPSQSDETHSLFYQSENEKSPLSRDRDMKFLREWRVFSCEKDSFLPVSTPPTLTPGHGIHCWHGLHCWHGGWGGPLYERPGWGLRHPLESDCHTRGQEVFSNWLWHVGVQEYFQIECCTLVTHKIRKMRRIRRRTWWEG